CLSRVRKPLKSAGFGAGAAALAVEAAAAFFDFRGSAPLPFHSRYSPGVKPLGHFVFSSNCAKSSDMLLRSAPVRSAPRRSAWASFAIVRSAPVRSAPTKLTWYRCVVVRLFHFCTPSSPERSRAAQSIVGAGAGAGVVAAATGAVAGTAFGFAALFGFGFGFA